MPIKSFRGLLADDTQETIHLHTNTGSTGYRIVKFQVMSPDANTNVEAVMKIYIVTFDNEIFNQDIYVTNKGQDNPSPVNYYIELEVVKLDLNENTVATLKDIRNETLAL